MKHYWEIWREKAHRESLLSPQPDPKENLTINGPSLEEKEKTRNVPLKHRKEIITVLPVMTLFLHAEINKEAMTVFKGDLEK